MDSHVCSTLSYLLITALDSHPDAVPLAVMLSSARACPVAATGSASVRLPLCWLTAVPPAHPEHSGPHRHDGCPESCSHSAPASSVRGTPLPNTSSCALPGSGLGDAGSSSATPVPSPPAPDPRAMVAVGLHFSPWTRVCNPAPVSGLWCELPPTLPLGHSIQLEGSWIRLLLVALGSRALLIPAVSHRNVCPAAFLLRVRFCPPKIRMWKPEP